MLVKLTKRYGTNIKNKNVIYKYMEEFMYGTTRIPQELLQLIYNLKKRNEELLKLLKKAQTDRIVKKLKI